MTNIELDISNLDKWDMLDMAQVLTAYAEDKMTHQARKYFNRDTETRHRSKHGIRNCLLV